MMKFLLMIFIFLLLPFGCNTDNQGPEATLKNFIDSRAGNKVDSKFILNHTTGKLKEIFENIPDQELNKFLDLKNIKKGSFKLLSKSCQSNSCNLTYAVSYQTFSDDNSKDKKIVLTEVKKIAEMVNQNGKWLISDVTNIKTYHDFKTPLDP